MFTTKLRLSERRMISYQVAKMSLLGRRSNCPICGSPLVPDLGEGWRLTRGASARGWLPEHLRDAHQDYLVWKKSKRNLSRIFGVAAAVSLDLMIAYAFFIFGIHLPPGRAGGAVFLLPSFGGYFLPSALIAQSGIRKFRREWMERGGLPAASGFASSLDVQLVSSLK